MTRSLTQLPCWQQSVCKVNVPKRKQAPREGKPDDEAETRRSEKKKKKNLEFEDGRTRVFDLSACIKVKPKQSANCESSQRCYVCYGRPGIKTSGGSGVGGGERAIYLTLESAVQTRSI